MRRPLGAFSSSGSYPSPEVTIRRYPASPICDVVVVVRGQEVVLRCPSYSPAVKWARLECKSYKIPEPATEIEPNDQAPSFLLSAEATPVDAIANAIRANKIKTDLEPSYPAAIMPRKRGGRR
jgi:hypothetical protein